MRDTSESLPSRQNADRSRAAYRALSTPRTNDAMCALSEALLKTTDPRSRYEDTVQAKAARWVASVPEPHAEEGESLAPPGRTIGEDGSVTIFLARTGAARLGQLVRSDVEVDPFFAANCVRSRIIRHSFPACRAETIDAVPFSDFGPGVRNRKDVNHA